MLVSSDGTFPYPLPYNNRYRITVTDINYFEGAKKYGYGYKLFRESKKKYDYGYKRF